MCLLQPILTTASLCALDRQPNADYRARRVALSKKLNGGVVVLFAATESEGPEAIYGFRQDNDFFYLTGWAEPGAAVVIASGGGGQGRDGGAAVHGDSVFAGAQPDAGKVDGGEAGSGRSAGGASDGL